MRADTCTHTHAHRYMRTDTYARIHAHIHMDTYTWIHTYGHIHIDTLTPASIPITCVSLPSPPYSTPSLGLAQGLGQIGLELCTSCATRYGPEMGYDRT